MAADGSFNMWDHVRLVKDPNSRALVGAVQCVMCEKFLSYSSKKNGNSSLVNHVKFACPIVKGKQNILPTFKSLPPGAKTSFVDKLADMSAYTLSSINHLTSERAPSRRGEQATYPSNEETHPLLPGSFGVVFYIVASKVMVVRPPRATRTHPTAFLTCSSLRLNNVLTYKSLWPYFVFG